MIHLRVLAGEVDLHVEGLAHQVLPAGVRVLLPHGRQTLVQDLTRAQGGLGDWEGGLRNR